MSTCFARCIYLSDIRTGVKLENLPAGEGLREREPRRKDIFAIPCDCLLQGALESHFHLHVGLDCLGISYGKVNEYACGLGRAWRGWFIRSVWLSRCDKGIPIASDQECLQKKKKKKKKFGWLVLLLVILL